MSKSSVHNAYGTIRVGDKPAREFKNAVNSESVMDAVVLSFIKDRHPIHSSAPLGATDHKGSTACGPLRFGSADCSTFPALSFTL